MVCGVASFILIEEATALQALFLLFDVHWDLGGCGSLFLLFLAVSTSRTTPFVELGEVKMNLKVYNYIN